MNRRSLLTFLLALPLLPAAFRSSRVPRKGDPFPGYIQTKPSSDFWWSCTAKDGTHVSFIASNDIGLAELEARKQLAMEAKKS